jgi:hypothetical protein
MVINFIHKNSPAYYVLQLGKKIRKSKTGKDNLLRLILADFGLRKKFCSTEATQLAFIREYFGEYSGIQ